MQSHIPRAGDVRTPGEGGCLQAWGGLGLPEAGRETSHSSQGNQSRQHLDFRLAAFRRRDNKCLLFKLPILWCFTMETAMKLITVGLPVTYAYGETCLKYLPHRVFVRIKPGSAFGD